MTNTAVFCAILVFLERLLLSVIHKNCVLQFKRDYLLFSSPKALFFKTSLGLSFVSCFFFIFCLPFQDRMFLVFFFHQPLVRSRSRAVSLLYLCCHSLLRVCFFPLNIFPDVPFSNPTCFHFGLFGSSVLHIYFFCSASCFLLCLFLLLVFVWFSCGCCFHLSFHVWCFSSSIIFVGFCFDFVVSVVLVSGYDKTVFPCTSGIFWVGLVQNQCWSGGSVSLCWRCDIRKTTGRFFSRANQDAVDLC